MTECNHSQLHFEAHFSRQVVADFQGERTSTEGGALLLREADRKIGLLPRAAACFSDGRDPQRIEHELEAMLAQRIYGLALGYEDLNDHEELRRDPLLALLAGKREIEEPLAGKSTLNRMELTPADSASTRYHKIRYSAEAIDALLVDIFVEAQAKPPRLIVLDLDVTDTPLHGEQEGRFFHGYYNHYCYLPLYIFCGQHLLCARVRPSNQDASAGSVAEVARIVRQIRRRWPHVRILLRADSGFCREELMAWCEKHRVDYLLGLARNERLRRKMAPQMRQAKQEHQRTGKAARVFAGFSYRTRKSWSRPRRVVAKAEYLEQGENPRYVVTSLDAQAWPAQPLYERLYLRAGRDGEPHQGTTEPVQRPPEHGNPARQPAASLLLLPGLCVGACAAAPGPGSNGMGLGAGGDDPAAAAQDGRPGARHRAPHLGPLLGCLSLERDLHCSLRYPDRLNQLLPRQPSSTAPAALANSASSHR